MHDAQSYVIETLRMVVCPILLLGSCYKQCCGALRELVAGRASVKHFQTELSSDVQAQIRELEALPDDHFDMPDARRGVFYRPVKQEIALRLDADIIAWFKARARDGRGYQTDINASGGTGRASGFHIPRIATQVAHGPVKIQGGRGPRPATCFPLRRPQLP